MQRENGCGWLVLTSLGVSDFRAFGKCCIGFLTPHIVKKFRKGLVFFPRLREYELAILNMPCGRIGVSDETEMILDPVDGMEEDTEEHI
jgi:hypothetical protein